MGVLELILVAVIVVPVLALLAGSLALLVALTRRSRRVEEEHTACITREFEKIDAMLASGRISAAESAELRQALEHQSPDAESPRDRGRLRKSSAPVLSGVCGGLAEWMSWDATLVRVGYVLATLLIAGFPGIIIYLVMALVMPEAEDAKPARTGRILLILLLVLLAPFLLFFAALGAGLVARAH